MSSLASGTAISTHMATNLANLLPTGTFLTFSTLAPLFTNNGSCGMTEKIMTGMLLGAFVGLVFVLNFVDSVTTQSGKVYYGIVTSKGLYNPQFARSNIPGDLRKGDNFFIGANDKVYRLNLFDIFNGILGVIAFATLSLLAAPITTCYYPNIPDTVIKTAPILVALVIGVVFAFAPPGRHGVGFAVTTAGFQLVPDTAPETITRQVSQRNIDTTNMDRLLEKIVTSNSLPSTQRGDSSVTRTYGDHQSASLPPQQGQSGRASP